MRTPKMMGLVIFYFLSSCSRSGIFLENASPVSGAGDTTGFEVGNGGTVVVCGKKEPLPFSVELVDFYIARQKWRSPFFHPSLGSDNLDVPSKIAIALTRLSRLDRGRAAKYQADANHFFEKSAFVSIQLPDTKDYGHIALPAHCQIQQIVVHKAGTIPQEVDFLVHRPFWEGLNRDDQAGLVLHEVIYQDAIRHGQTDSLNTRAFNALIVSEELDNYSQSAYDSQLSSLHFVTSQEVPPVWPNTPWFLPYTACVGMPFHFDMAPYINSTAGSNVIYSPTQLPNWLGLSTAGILDGVASEQDCGLQKVSVLAARNQIYSPGEIWFNVMDCVNAPPFAIQTHVGTYFQFELPYLIGSKFYVKRSGPKWLSGTVGSSLVMGRPGSEDQGENAFVFRLILTPGPVEFLDFKLNITVSAAEPN